jgi:hypothetical protein
MPEVSRWPSGRSSATWRCRPCTLPATFCIDGVVGLVRLPCRRRHGADTRRTRPGHAPPLCARMGETVPPSEITVAGGRDILMEARVEIAVTPEDVQVAAKPRRRSFTAEYKRRILKEASHLVEWRRARARGARRPDPEEARPQTHPRRFPRPEDRRARAPSGAHEGPGRAGGGPGGGPKKLGVAARPAGGERAVMIALVEERRVRLGIAPLCDALRVARATFYRRRRAPPPGPVASRTRRERTLEMNHGSWMSTRQVDPRPGWAARPRSGRGLMQVSRIRGPNWSYAP